MISEGSCDIKDWSNYADNSALHQRNKMHLKKEKDCKENCKDISQYHCFFYCIFTSKCRIGEHERLNKNLYM